MLVRSSLVLTVAVGPVVIGAGAASGQNYPSRPVRIVTSETGGANDIVARMLVPDISARLNQQVIVDNRNGVSGPEIAARGLPDGYTLYLGASSLWIAPLLRSGGTSYDPVKDFAPITLVDTTPNIVVVSPSLPVKSIKELIALAKAKPGALNYASGSTGAPTHLAVELFKQMAGVDIVRIPFKGAGPAVISVLGGETQVMFASLGSVAAPLKAGKLRALAVTTAEPSTLAPGIPTVASAGLRGYEASSMHAIFAPAKTPVAIIQRLNQDIVRALSQPEIKEKFLASGVEPAGGSPQQLAATVKADMARMGKVIKDAGIRED